MLTNIVGIDWLTVTTFDVYKWEEIRNYVHDEMNATIEMYGRDYAEHGEGKKMQYIGETFTLKKRGTFFVGEGEQNHRPHFIAWASSGLANDLFMFCKDMIAREDIRVTRFDVQITIEKPDDWSQLELAMRVDKEYGRIRLENSKGLKGKLYQVEAGYRTSDRMVRIYEKEDSEGNTYLRFEAELKQERGRLTGLRCAQGTMGINNIMRYEINRYRDDKVRALYLPYVVDFQPMHVKIVHETSTQKRELWIKKTVIPALKGWAQMHDRHTGLLDELILVLLEIRENEG